jgi:hypothetical protein
MEKQRKKCHSRENGNPEKQTGFPRIPSAKFTLSETNVLGTSKSGAVYSRFFYISLNFVEPHG